VVDAKGPDREAATRPRARGVKRDSAWMAKLVAACTAAIESEPTTQTQEALRDALIIRLRDHHGCTLEQIGDALGITGERVRQLYRRVKGPSTRQARLRRAPIKELSPSAIAALREAGLEPHAKLHDVAVLIPLLELSLRQRGDRQVSAEFHMPHINRTTLDEIEEWLERHGVVIRR
jgi:hypothetical protein